jgi:hypothetical protein
MNLALTRRKKKRNTRCLTTVYQPTKGAFTAASYALIAYQTSGLPQQKVQLVVADGRFDAQQDLEYQDKVAQKLVLYQVAAGLCYL